MHLQVVLRVTGVLLSIFSLALLLPAVVAWIYGEPTVQVFMLAFLLTGGTGLFLWGSMRGTAELRGGDGFLVTALFYVALTMAGTLPFLLDSDLDLSFTDAAFESMSGLTTTGATVLTGLDGLHRSLLFYRQLLQWFGGMGIIVLAVAILPMLGIGGMQLYRAESPGPVKDTKLTPRITETARALWMIYVGLTLACGLAFWLAGMTAFDAICHSFSTVSIGGFSTHDASFGFFNSPAIEMVAILFMVISAINFGLHFSVFRAGNVLQYFRDPESRALFGLIFLGFIVISGVLLQHGADSERPLLDALFQVVSMLTTTGFTSADYTLWPAAASTLLIIASFAGGCAGSTAGGIKIVRVLLLFKQGLRELRILIHPAAVYQVKLGGHRVSDKVVSAVWSFCAVYALTFLALFVLASLLSGLDFQTSFSAVAASLNNLGPGLGEVAANFQAVNEPTKWVLIVAMLLGRLEILTILVLLTPLFWRR